jgi:hypothetical protein
MLIHTYNQGYACDGTRRDAVPKCLFLRDESRNGVPELSPGIGFTRLGVSCYSVALLSNKLANSVQFLKENYPPTEFWVGLCVP